MSQNVEQLRASILRGIDDTLDAPIVSRFLSRDQKRLLRASRNYWQQDDGVQLAKLAALLDQEPIRAEDEQQEAVGAINHPGWLPGPLPPRTWNWGGVVEAGNMSGFRFADFHGNHVKADVLELVEGHGENLYRYSKRVIPADQVAFYNNALDLPPGVIKREGGAE